MARASAGICLGHLEELLLEQRKKFGEAVKGDLARKEDRPTIAKLADGAGGHLQHCWHSPPTG